MRRAFLLCAAIAFAIACGDSVTEPVPNRTRSTPPVSFATSTSEDGLVITTDKDDYSPGDTVHFTGSGWQAGDTLDIVLVDDAETQETHSWSVTVVEDGTFQDSTYVVDTDDLGVTFTLTATSRATGRSLTVVFTDGNFKYTTSPANLVASITLTQRATTTCPGGMNQGSVTANYNANVALNTSSHYVFSVPTVSGYTYDGYTLGNNNITVSPASDPGNNQLCVVSLASGAGSMELAYLDNTTTELGHTPTTTNVAQSVTFTATVKDHLGSSVGNKGSVTFYEFTGTQTCVNPGAAVALAGPSNLNPSGQASFQTTTLTAGTHVLTACYGGTSAFTASFGSATHVVGTPDTQAPVINCTVPNPAVWYSDNVTVPCTASDAGSGLANSADASFSLSTNVSAGTETPTAGTGNRQVCDNLNNCATAGPYSFRVDRKAPVISCGAADGTWHAANISIGCTASDAGSGLANAGDASFSLSTSVAVGSETNNASTDSKSVVDVAGNSANAGPIGGNMIDRKAPVVSCGSSDGVWHAANVSISCSASDGGSGLANAADASFNLSTSVAAGTETSTASTGSRNVLDNVGNSATGGPVTGNMIDRKAPLVSCNAADGSWHADDVSIGCTASDGGSGLANAGDGSFNLTTSVTAGEETNDASTGSKLVADAVGNSATAGPVAGNKVDKKAPAVSCGSADTDWHATNISISCSASDGGSGLQDPADGSFALMTSVAAGNETNNAATGSKMVPDAVGNSVTAGPIVGNRIDRKAPVVTLTCPASSLLLNAPVTASWSATENGSGFAGPSSGTISVPTGTVGPNKTVAVQGGVTQDAVGNSSNPSNSCSYSVAFVFAGFRTPVDNGVMNTANSGQAIPLKWELRDYAGIPVTNLASVSVTAVTLSCAAGSTTDLIEEYAAGASGLINNGGGSYQFNWKTPASYAKSCKTMSLDLGEGTPRTAAFEFKQ
jgi:hypothetical protein